MNDIKKRSFWSLINPMRTNSMSPTLIIVYVIMAVLIYLLNPIFLTVQNFQAILSNMPLIGFLAIGLTFVVLTGNIDLSIGSVVGITAVIVGNLFDLGFPIPLPFVFLIGILTGAIIGAINGFLVTVVGINSVITTLGTLTALRGLALIVGARVDHINHETFIFLARGFFFDTVPLVFIYMIVMLVIMYILLRFTKFGRNVYLVGANQSAATMAGINNRRIQFLTFVISGSFAAIAGILLTAQTAWAQGGFGVGWEFRALVICFIGGISIRGGRGTLVGVFISMLIISSIANGLTLANVPINWRDAFDGTILILAILVDSIRVRRRELLLA